MIELRSIKESDAPTIFKWKQDEYVKQMALDYNYQTTLQEQQNDIKNALNNEYAIYQLILYNQEPIGYVRVDWMDELKEMAWIRFALGEQRGKGLGGRGLSLFLTKLFADGCKRVEGETYQNNIPSQKVLEKLGFVREGMKRKAHYNGNQYIDIYVYGLLKEEYKEIK